MLLRWLVSTCVVFFVSGSLLTAGAFPDRVAVSLFEAYPRLSSIVVQGPFIALYPGEQRMPSGQYDLRAQAGQVEVLTGAQGRYGPNGRPTARISMRSQRLVLEGAQGRLTLKYPGKSPRRYRGTVTISVDKSGKLNIVNELSSRDYVVSVVGSECLPEWPAEALKCQAILTQTRLARYKLGDPLGDSTQREVYLGADHERPTVRAAVDAVWGRILTHDKRPVEAFYHSTCAGGTSNAADLFAVKAGSFPYLPGVACHYCKGSPFFLTKKARIPSKAFDRLVAGTLPKIVSRDDRDRPLKVSISANNVQTGYAFWITVGQKLGWDKVPGTRYDLSRLPDGATEIKSTGAGHGIGLCQWGAAEQARRGRTYRSILKYYFPGTQIQE